MISSDKWEIFHQIFVQDNGDIVLIVRLMAIFISGSLES